MNTQNDICVAVVLAKAHHVLVTRKKDFFKCIAFTPEDPEEFARIARSILPGRA
jgi:hypothetical protein